ncbi:MAG: HPF/RaiA family ribosome-associated protein [Bryobacteraceae bacterium]
MMKVTYTGGNGEFGAAEKSRLEAKLAKLGKMIDKRGEQEAHVILTAEKRDKKAEITVNYLHHSFVAVGSGAAFPPAVSEALVKMEKQIGKLTDKRRDGKRNGVKPAVLAAADAVKPAPAPAGPQLYQAKVSKKPMNVDEAVLVSMRKKVNYIAFRDADSGGISIVIQRADGNFDVVRA